MIDELKPYAKTDLTKLAGLSSEINIPWLTRIPNHWIVVRSKHLFTARKERARPKDEQLSATQAYGVIPQKEFESRVGRKVVRITQHLEKRAHVEKDDFVISMRSFQGGLERARAAGCIRSSYVVLKPSPEAYVGYFTHLFKSHDYIRAIQATSNFIRDGQDLNFANFRLVDLPLPPLIEQGQIASFLDHANGKIEQAIRAKRKLIALLNEQKQAIIHRAVTRGLDPAVKLKTSDIPWLDSVPAHWNIMGLGRICASRCDGPFGSGLKSSHYIDTGVRVIRLQNIGMGEFRNNNAAYISQEHYATLGDHNVVSGDLLVAGLGDDQTPAGRACLAPSGIEPAMVKADCFRFRISPGRVIPRFIAMHLSATAAAATACLSTGATRLRINLMASSARSIAFPPIAEQDAIVAHVESEHAPIFAASSRIEREIALLREYRTRLTADVVTGKLDVRKAAIAQSKEFGPVNLRSEGEETTDDNPGPTVEEAAHADD